MAGGRGSLSDVRYLSSRERGLLRQGSGSARRWIGKVYSPTRGRYGPREIRGHCKMARFLKWEKVALFWSDYMMGY